VLKAQINKTDRNDARGIAQMIRVGLYRPVHVKTLRSQKLRMLLTHRKLLQSGSEGIFAEGRRCRALAAPVTAAPMVLPGRAARSDANRPRAKLHRHPRLS
jgi:hypothetical protein